jgi:hypothetical protein
VTLSLYEWKELKKTIPLFEDREPELLHRHHHRNPPPPPPPPPLYYY